MTRQTVHGFTSFTFDDLFDMVEGGEISPLDAAAITIPEAYFEIEELAA